MKTADIFLLLLTEPCVNYGTFDWSCNCPRKTEDVVSDFLSFACCITYTLCKQLFSTVKNISHVSALLLLSLVASVVVIVKLLTQH